MKKLVLSSVMLMASLQATDYGLEEKDASGIYIGVGVAISTFDAAFYDNTYYFPEDGDDTVNREKSSMYANDTGYKIYGGYQFNKIIGVEFSYNDYGHLENDLLTQDPYSITLAANAGYNFLNNQLRPFGILGLGYMKTNQNRELFDEDVATLHFGLGAEYYPTVLKGVGFRLGLEGDYMFKSQYAYHETVNDTEVYEYKLLYRDYVNYFLAVAYKF